MRFHPHNRSGYLIAAVLVLAALSLLFGLVTCGTDPDEVAVQTIAKPATRYDPPRYSATTTTTQAPIIPGSENDPWGPILCPSVGHPAHHSACVPRAERPQSYSTSTSGATGGGWEALKQCESGGDYTQRGPNFSGAHQFTDETWRSVGGTGRAADASPAEQDARAQTLYERRGAQPWPVCGRHIR